MIAIFTLGFDIKFQIRALVKRAKGVDKVVIIGGFSEEKSKKALEDFTSFLNEVSIPYKSIEVDPHDFQDIVVKVGKLIVSNPGEEFLINLSGGMRLLNFAVFSAFLLTGVDAEVEIETEDFKTVYNFRVKDVLPLSIPLTKDHIEILKAIYDGLNSTSSISKRAGVPLTTTWRRLNELKKEGLIDDSNNLTNKGKIIVKIYES